MRSDSLEWDDLEEYLFQNYQSRIYRIKEKEVTVSIIGIVKCLKITRNTLSTNLSAIFSSLAQERSSTLQSYPFRFRDCKTISVPLCRSHSKPYSHTLLRLYLSLP